MSNKITESKIEKLRDTLPLKLMGGNVRVEV